MRENTNIINSNSKHSDPEWSWTYIPNLWLKRTVILANSVNTMMRSLCTNLETFPITDMMTVQVTVDFSVHIGLLEGMGAYGPLFLAPVEGLEGPSGPLASGGNIF